jgi:hypothetical protein
MKSVPALALAATLLLGAAGAAPAWPAPESSEGTQTARGAPTQAAPAGNSLGSPDARTAESMELALLEALAEGDSARVEEAVRSLCVLAMTMSFSPVDIWYVKPQSNQPPNVPPPENVPPPDVPPPFVLQPPPEQPPPPDQPPPPPPPLRVPEPAALATALVGSALAALAWWRRRRRKAAQPSEAAVE